VQVNDPELSKCCDYQTVMRSNTFFNVVAIWILNAGCATEVHCGGGRGHVTNVSFSLHGPGLI